MAMIPQEQLGDVIRGRGVLLCIPYCLPSGISDETEHVS